MNELPLPKGFAFAGVSCGIKDTAGVLDVALFRSDVDAVGAGVYTQNIVRAASVIRNEQITPSDRLRAVMITSGNANACTGDRGHRDNQQMADWLADQLECESAQCLTLSTGIIGEYLPMDKIQTGIAEVNEQAAPTSEGFDQASRAILTTDLGPKVAGCRVELSEGPITILGTAKGAGMIAPNMATMHCVLMTDAALQVDVADRVLRTAADVSFNSISVDGHTSTSDSMLFLANGQSSSRPLSEADLTTFRTALNDVSIQLAKMVPSDGEGSSHLITIQVSGTSTDEDAKMIARTISESALVKTAVTGNDPNWGRFVSAAGYAGVEFNVNEVGLAINGLTIYENGQPIEFSDAEVSQSMKDNFECVLDLCVGVGPGKSTFWTSDLTCDYVRFNSDYHT